MNHVPIILAAAAAVVVVFVVVEVAVAVVAAEVIVTDAQNPVISHAIVLNPIPAVAKVAVVVHQTNKVEMTMTIR
jgi:hypothetical protein